MKKAIHPVPGIILTLGTLWTLIGIWDLVSIVWEATSPGSTIPSVVIDRIAASTMTIFIIPGLLAIAVAVMIHHQAGGPARAEKECPHCAEPILEVARVCKHCGRDIAPAPSI